MCSHTNECKKTMACARSKRCCRFVAVTFVEKLIQSRNALCLCFLFVMSKKRSVSVLNLRILDEDGKEVRSKVAIKCSSGDCKAEASCAGCFCADHCEVPFCSVHRHLPKRHEHGSDVVDDDEDVSAHVSMSQMSLGLLLFLSRSFCHNQ